MAETQVDAEAAAVTPVMPAAVLAVMPAALAVMPSALAVMPTDVLAVTHAAVLAMTPAFATAATARPCNRLIAEAETEQRYCERGRHQHTS